jgi:hypothetical protein
MGQCSLERLADQRVTKLSYLRRAIDILLALDHLGIGV